MIKNDKELKAIVTRVGERGYVAIDTEFVWEKTYYPRLGLIQVALSREECFLIDVTELGDLSPLGDLLSDGKIIKILHDAQQDLTILRRATGAWPTNIFDTRLVAGFAGLGSSISLRDLINAVVSIELHKTETRTDWLKRPLSEAQIRYAREDVCYLPETKDDLLRRVKALGREKWLREELQKYNDPSLYKDKDPFTQYGRLKGTGRFKRSDLSVLRELAAWREKEAILHDRPRGHILKDEVIVALARKKVRSQSDLKGIKGMSDKEARLYGTAIIKAVERGLSLKENEWPRLSDNNGADERLNARIDLALACVKGKCIASGMDMALVASRAELTEFLSNHNASGKAEHPLNRGWRKDFIGDELLDLMAGRKKIVINPAAGLPELVKED